MILARLRSAKSPWASGRRLASPDSVSTAGSGLYRRRIGTARKTVNSQIGAVTRSYPAPGFAAEGLRPQPAILNVITLRTPATSTGSPSMILGL